MIILYASLIFTCVWFGVLYSKKLTSRYMMFYEMFQFFKVYEENISFRQDNLKDIARQFLETCKSEFAIVLRGSILCEKCSNIESLSPKEISFVNQLLLSLGKSDKDTELQQIRHLQFLTNECLVKAKEAKEKYSMLSIKISFFVGLLLVVLLL